MGLKGWLILNALGLTSVEQRGLKSACTECSGTHISKAKESETQIVYLVGTTCETPRVRKERALTLRRADRGSKGYLVTYGKCTATG